METLKNYINAQIDIAEAELDIILSNFQELTLAEGRFALRRGQLATNYYFVVSGGFRIYFDHNGKEITSWVALENEFFTDLSSLKNKVPSRFNIQAMEDTVLLTIKSDKMEQLYKQFPAWQQFGRQNAEANFMKLVDGIIGFQTMTAEERYLKAVQEPELLQRMPLKYLASYLGITPTSLSRLRKMIR